MDDEYESEYDIIENDEEDEGLDDSEEENGLSDYEVEMAGSLDGEQEGWLGMADYSNHGSSVDLDDLTDAQREIYDNAYHSSKNATGNEE